MNSPEMEKQLRSNIPKLYGYAFFLTFLIIIPVIVPFWMEKGLTIQQIFMLQGIFGASLILFDAPAGYAADFFGRKRALMIGSLISALGFQFLWFAESFLQFAIYEIILGLGLSLQSGCDVAILYNTMDKLKLEGRKAAYLGKRLMMTTVGEGIASLLGGFLAVFSLNWPAYATAITSWMPLLFAMTLIEPEGDKLPRASHLQNLKSIRDALFGHSRLLTWVIVNFIFYSFATYCAIWTFQPYWKERGLEISMFGYVWAAICFMIAIAGNYAHKIEETIGSTKSVILISVLPVMGYLGMGFAGGLWGLLFMLCFPVCRGINQVLFQDAINTRVPANMRATTNSIGSLGMRILFIVFGPLLGMVLDKHGADMAMYVMGSVYFVGLFVIAWPLLRERRQFQISN